MGQLFSTPQSGLSSDDYYTPKAVFDRLGIEFDIDVAAPPGGIPWIPAKRFFTMADDGLAQPWEGRVWMNPPYSNATPWVRRFVEHRDGVALLPFAKSQWLFSLWQTDAAIVVTERKVQFFVGGDVRYPTFLAAYEAECVAAIGRFGRIR